MGIGLVLASAVSGCLSRTVVHPLDTIRSRMMVSTSMSSEASFTNVASTLMRTDGIRGLYRGFGVSVVMQAPAISAFLTTYDWSKAKLSSTYSHVNPTLFSASSPVVHLSAALIAETASAVFWVPMEVIKQRAQVRAPGSSATSLGIVRDLLKHEGVGALFRGYGITIAVYGPYSMLYFSTYEKLKKLASGSNKQLQHQQQKVTLSVPVTASCAGLAGGFAAACTTPLDVIKTRIQTQDDVQVRANRNESGSKATTYRSTWHAVQQIVRREGAVALFRGVSARVLWCIPSTAISMSTFEYLKSYYNLSAS